MKKFLYSMAAMLMLAASATVFTACSDDNDEPNAPEEKVVKEAVITTSLYVNQALADAYAITGKSFLGQSISLSAKPTEVTFRGQKTQMYTMTLEGTSNAVPLTAIMNVTFSLKDGYQLPDKSNFAIAAVASGTIAYTDGTKDTFAATGYELENNGVLSTKIDEYTSHLNKYFGRIKAVLDDDGIEIDTTSDD